LRAKIRKSFLKFAAQRGKLLLAHLGVIDFAFQRLGSIAWPGVGGNHFFGDLG
jgi:hypothetical protein